MRLFRSQDNQLLPMAKKLELNGNIEDAKTLYKASIIINPACKASRFHLARLTENHLKEKSTMQKFNQ
jgi:hypothetical protein